MVMPIIETKTSVIPNPEVDEVDEALITPMDVERLEALIHLLENLDPKQAFDMSVFGHHLGDHKPTEADHNHCGTSACALGWAGLNPKFNSLGLVSRWETEYNADETKLESSLTITCRGHEGFSAGAVFFGLAHGAAEHLFDPDEYEDFYPEDITAQVVAQRVRDLINNRGRFHPNPSGDVYYMWIL